MISVTFATCAPAGQRDLTCSANKNRRRAALDQFAGLSTNSRMAGRIAFRSISR